MKMQSSLRGGRVHGGTATRGVSQRLSVSVGGGGGAGAHAGMGKAGGGLL